MKERSVGIRHFFAALRYSLSGLRMALGESAFRQELLLGVANIAALILLPLSFSVRLILLALWALILIVELLNTSLEAVVDIVTPEYHELAKRAKDLASAAVFISIVLFFAVWALNLVDILV